MDSVVQLVNRLQSVATKLGDNAATAKDGGLPSLWDLLPSIVVIGGQVGTWEILLLSAPWDLSESSSWGPLTAILQPVYCQTASRVQMLLLLSCRSSQAASAVLPSLPLLRSAFH